MDRQGQDRRRAIRSSSGALHVRPRGRPPQTPAQLRLHDLAQPRKSSKGRSRSDNAQAPDPRQQPDPTKQGVGRNQTLIKTDISCLTIERPQSSSRCVSPQNYSTPINAQDQPQAPIPRERLRPRSQRDHFPSRDIAPQCTARQWTSCDHIEPPDARSCRVWITGLKSASIIGPKTAIHCLAVVRHRTTRRVRFASLRERCRAFGHLEDRSVSCRSIPHSETVSLFPQVAVPPSSSAIIDCKHSTPGKQPLASPDRCSLRFRRLQEVCMTTPTHPLLASPLLRVTRGCTGPGTFGGAFLERLRLSLNRFGIPLSVQV